MTYRDDLEAERARAEALAQRAEDLARENAELHKALDARPVAAPQPKQATRIATSTTGRPFLAALGVAAGIAFMAAIVGSGVFVASMKLAAPIACPAGYSRSIVVLHVSSTSKGGTSYRGDLWCVFPRRERAPQRPPALAVLGVLFGEYLLGLGPLALGIAAMRRRRRA